MKILSTFTLFLLLTSCVSQPTVERQLVLADVLILNASIWTGDPQLPEATTLAIKGNEIVYVGDNDGSSFNAKTSVNLNGKFLMPGFIDNHVHFLEGGFGLASVDLRDADTPEIFSNRIIDYAKTLQADQWVLNGNWDHTLWGGELPHRNWIDEGTGDRPVLVFRIDGHMALANSAALKLAGVTADTVTPEGGEIVRDKIGEPTGVLKDTAAFMVLNAKPKASDQELLKAVALAQNHAFSLGLTQVHAMTASPTETNMLDVFQLARDRGVLKLRANVFTPLESWQTAHDVVTASGHGDELLRWGGVKGLVDGALGSATAWFYEPFSDDPSNRGFPLIKPEVLDKLINEADQAGLKLAIHGIGDKAIDILIDSFEKAAGEQIVSRRYRIEHFQHPSADAISRIAKLGIIAAAHPYHAIDDGRWAEQKIGPERIKTTYAFRSIIDAGGILSFGSDWPVAPLSPLAGVYAAVTRQTIDGNNPQGWQPQERISVEEALIAYTANNAYAGFEENRAGTLEVGKRADMVVLSGNPLRIAPEQIKELNVLATMVGGELVFGNL